MTSFIVVPQWQGSGSARAMQLVTGAETIRGDLPQASTVTVDVPLEAGASLDTGVSRASSIDLIRQRVRAALEENGGPAIVIGGDCSVELGAVEHASASQGDVALVWFDAHADINLPETSPSGAFTGMVVRSLMGQGPELLASAAPLAASRIVLAGARDLDDAEAAFVESEGIAHIFAADLTAEALVEAVAATGAQSVYLHIDLDVLDPDAITGIDSPVPFGLSVPTLIESIVALKSRFRFAGAGVTEFAPATPASAADDMGTILRIIGALSRPV